MLPHALVCPTTKGARWIDCMCVCDWRRYAQAKDDTTGETIGAVVSKLEQQRGAYRGYIAMLAVDSKYRKRGVGTEMASDQQRVRTIIESVVRADHRVSGTELVVRTIEEMQANGAQEVRTTRSVAGWIDA